MRVIAVASSPTHSFSKTVRESIRLLAGLGVEGDAHAGVTVRHRSRLALEGTLPNRRQVHLVAAELFDELRAKGFEIGPGEIGENVTTAGLDLLALPAGATLRLGAEAVIEITGLRQPCGQLDRFRPGLRGALLDRAGDGTVVRRAGVMAVVRTGGWVRPGDPIGVTLPPPPHRALDRV